jgi:SAM-dependent methyltransferase
MHCEARTLSDSASTPNTATGDALAASYDDVPYTSAPSPARHPERLATIGQLLGLDVPPVSNCRVLELACGDGASLLSVAATLPDAHFVGVDFAAQPIARARRMADAIGVANVELMQLDIRALPPDLGRFDYVIAHGLYSWIRAEVRAHLMPAIARHLAPGGVAYVSYNTLPGSYMRAVVWDMLKYHTREIADTHGKLVPARALLELVATPVATDSAGQQAMRSEVRDTAQSSDAALAHDDLSEPNIPVHFHQFAADAARAGLAFLAEAHANAMTVAGLAPHVRETLARLDRISREQYLDFIYFRRFRESLVCHSEALSRAVVEPARTLRLHALPSLEVRTAAARGEGNAMDAQASAIVRVLLERWPQSVPVAEIDARRKRDATQASPPTERLVLDLYGAGMIELRTAPISIARVAGERPRAFSAARWLTRDHEVIPSLYHAPLRYRDPLGRALLALLDGSRTRAELCAELGGPFAGAEGPGRLDRALGVLAGKALLVA